MRSVIVELNIIKSLLKYDNWLKYNEKISIKDLPKELQPILSSLNSFYATNTIDLSIADLSNLVLATPRKDPEYYEKLFEHLATLEVSDITTGVLIDSFYKQRLLKEISLSAYDLTEGKGSLEEFNSLLSKLNVETPLDEPEESEFVSDDLEQLLNETFRQPGLRWRLNALNRMFGSLRGGDFGFIFARPETGKTTFLADQTTFMASQLPDDAGPVIWFNNEEAHNKVKIRCYQAALGCSLAQLNSNPAAARDAFLKATKGKHLIPKTTGSISKKQVESIVRKYKPSLVIFDQIDKLVGFEADREDLKLGAIYQWGRDLGKEFGYATIGVCQADGSGEGQKWLTMANVANAKTSKQAEADWILGIGKSNDVGYEMLRYLHASKNKLAGDPDTDPTLRHGRLECLIKPEIARYADI